MVFCCQPVVELTLTETLLWLDENESVFGNGLVGGANIHQNVNFPGPVTVLCRAEDCPLFMSPLCTASIPSWVVVVSGNQFELPPLIQVKSVVFNAVAKSVINAG